MPTARRAPDATKMIAVAFIARRTLPAASGAQPVTALTNRAAASDATVALVEDIFGPGVGAIAERQPAIRPPVEIPSSTPTIDQYAATAPMPCPGCRALDWHKPAGHTGWICRMGRPPPDQSVGSAPA